MRQRLFGTRSGQKTKRCQLTLQLPAHQSSILVANHRRSAYSWRNQLRPSSKIGKGVICQQFDDTRHVRMSILDCWKHAVSLATGLRWICAAAAGHCLRRGRVCSQRALPCKGWTPYWGQLSAQTLPQVGRSDRAQRLNQTVLK